ncbi:MarR family transcriptional regulator [bacterium]|nr:MarR family transcriptional regulator [bacterium]
MQYTLVKLVEIITKLIDDLEAEFTKKYQEEGFTTRQIVYIDTINMLGNPNLGEIAKALKLSKPSVTAIVDKLASKGYIEKFQSDEDRRSFHVHLSAKGKNLVKMHAQTHNKIVDMLQDNLDSRDLKNLVTILNKVVSKV